MELLRSPGDRALPGELLADEWVFGHRSKDCRGKGRPIGRWVCIRTRSVRLRFGLAELARSLRPYALDRTALLWSNWNGVWGLDIAPAPKSAKGRHLLKNQLGASQAAAPAAQFRGVGLTVRTIAKLSDPARQS